VDLEIHINFHTTEYYAIIEIYTVPDTSSVMVQFLKR